MYHVTNTWLLGVAINPFLFTIALGLFDADWNVAIFTASSILGFFFSLPAYVACLVSAKLIMELPIGAKLRFAIWLITIATTVPVTFCMAFALLFGASEFYDLWWISAPGSFSALLAGLFRHKQFFKQLNYQMTFYENDSVATTAEKSTQ